MKISVYQITPEPDTPSQQWDKVAASVKKSKEMGSHLFILPEFFSTGFNIQMIKAHATTLNTGCFADLSQMARVNEIYILGTHPEVHDEKIYNTTVLWDSKGNVAGTFNKWHLFSPLFEDRVITPGDSLGIFDTPWAKMGVVICYDLRFPELTRQLTLKGAELIIVPALWPQPRLNHWRVLLQARAIENQVFVAGCNCASEQDKSNFGQSMIINPDGKILAEAGSEEVLLHVQIDMEEIHAIRKDFPVLKDRKAGQYGQF